MPALTAPLLVAALLLVAAGGAKAVDPTMTVGALRALGLPSASLMVRAGAVAEALIGVLAIVVGGAVWWSLVAASYLAFAAFVVVALRAGSMVGSCGCFGREETPPHGRRTRCVRYRHVLEKIHFPLGWCVATPPAARSPTSSGPPTRGRASGVRGGRRPRSDARLTARTPAR